MDIVEIALLAIIQGITEFLPISSSAHLILPSKLLGWDDQGMVFDVAVHLGSLVAIIAYFKNDVINLTKAWFAHVLKGQVSRDAVMAWSVVVATLPAMCVGFLLSMYEIDLRSLVVIATTTLVFGVLLGIADRKGRHNQGTEINLKHAIFIGLMQCLALVPGTSRSGITMTAALMMGLSREASARFSFLLSVPLIIAASVLKGCELLQTSSSVDWLSLGLGIVLSFISAFLCIHWFLKMINRMGFMPFVIYRLILAGVLFFIVFMD